MAKDIHAQSVPLPRFPMSAHDLSNGLKLCSSAGWMNSHYVEECIPSDIAHIQSDVFIRLDPLTFPIMHKVKVRQNFFFVPSRLILGDANQEEFFSCKDLGAKLPAFKIMPPQQGEIYGVQHLGKNSVFDQMGCQPVLDLNQITVPKIVRNPVPFLAYQKIWADWYADEIYDAAAITQVEGTLQEYQEAQLGDQIPITPQTSLNPFLRRTVSYSKDRFTSAQPDAQRVGEVYLMNPLQVSYVDGTSPTAYQTVGLNPSGQFYGITDQKNLRASLTIDELWDEMAVQRFLNSLNEFGNERYIEILAGQYGVISADARLQRSQWLGGNELVVNISEVLQTSETSEGSPLGNFAGRGIVAGRGRDIVFKVPEHGYIIGILSIVPENAYASGSPRWVYKSTPLDFAMPRFNNLGEQAVYKGELASDHEIDGETNDLEEFGYQPQYDEYRSHPSRVTGDFRESQFLSWHLARKFSVAPPLNADFIHISSTETNRIFNDTDPESVHYRIDSYHKAMYVRPISKHPIPGKL